MKNNEIITVKDLREALAKMDDNAHIIIGCQGYTSNYNDDDTIRINQVGDEVYITDYIHYDEID